MALQNQEVAVAQNSQQTEVQPEQIPVENPIRLEESMGDDSLSKVQRYHAYLEEMKDESKKELEVKSECECECVSESVTESEPEPIYLGTLTKTERQEKIRRYMEKKQHRKSGSKIRYDCRKTLAD